MPQKRMTCELLLEGVGSDCEFSEASLIGDNLHRLGEFLLGNAL